MPQAQDPPARKMRSEEEGAQERSRAHQAPTRGPHRGRQSMIAHVQSPAKPESSFKPIGIQKERSHVSSIFRTASRTHLFGAVLLALVTSMVFVTTAGATPSLTVELTHSPASMPRNFEQLTYFAKVKNIASPNPAAGDQLFCNGIETSTGTP